MFRRFFNVVQDVIDDILGNKDDTQVSSTAGASGLAPIEPQSIGTSRFQPDVYHALLIYHEDEEEEVHKLQQNVNQIVLSNGRQVRVALEDDLAPSGEIETAAFSGYFKKNVLFLLFITEPFIKSNIHKWKSDVGLTVSLTYGSSLDREQFVVPIFTEDKRTAPYLMNDPVLQALTGIKYHGCTWNNTAKKAFKRNFENAERRISLLCNGSSVD